MDYTNHPKGVYVKRKILISPGYGAGWSDPSGVTCSVCLRLIRKPATTMSVIKSAAVLFLLTAAACPLPPDSESESGSTTEVETTSGEDEPGSDVSTSTDTTTDASTTGDPTTGECDEPCIVAECNDGETCRPHPTTGHVTCVGPCEVFGVVCEAEVCGELVPGVCVADPLGLGWCFPN